MSNPVARILRVHDAGAYLAVGCTNPVTAWKLQQLLYFAQGFALAALDRVIVNTTFEAWSRGPASPLLHAAMDEQIILDTVDGGVTSRIDGHNKVILDSIIETFDATSAEVLTQLATKPNTPWANLRAEHGIATGTDSNLPIPEEYMAAYFREHLRLDR